MEPEVPHYNPYAEMPLNEEGDQALREMEESKKDPSKATEEAAAEKASTGTKAASSNYKQEKEKILKTNFDDETNWNYLFMNQDAVATSMAKQLN